MIRLGQRSDQEIFCLIFFPVGILEIFSNFSHMYFSHLQVCGKKIRLGCQWVQGFQGHYTRCGCDFPVLSLRGLTNALLQVAQVATDTTYRYMCDSYA